MTDPNHRRRLIDALGVYFADNVKARRLLSDGTYERVGRKGPRVRAQQAFYREAAAAVREAAHATPQFRPLTRPPTAELAMRTGLFAVLYLPRGESYLRQRGHPAGNQP